MDSVDSAKNIEPVAKGLGSKYNFQHFVFVTKYRYKMFRNPKTIGVIKKAFYDAAERHKLSIKEFSFGEDFAHVHMELDIPNTLSVIQVIQILKSHSASVIFQKIPNFRKLYPRGSFWGYQYSNSSVGPVGEHIIQNYIRRQDISQKYSEKQRRLFN